jgi:hypothetical protein
MKPAYLLLVLLLFVSVGCRGKRARLLFSQASPDQSKKVEIWWHPESDFEFQSDTVWVVLTDASDSANLVAQYFFPEGTSSTQYHNLMKENLSISIDWGKEAFEAKVIDADSRIVLLENPKKKTEQDSSGNGG